MPGSGDQLHLAYIRPTDAGEAPAGVYYRSANGGNWGPARLIDSSAYFRTIKPEQAHVSVAGNEAGNVIIAWDQPPLDQGQFARSSDQGVTWSEPQPAIGADAGQARRARVAFGPNSEFLLQWQDPSAPGCGFTQRRSRDNGETWTTPEVVLSTLTRCDTPWSFATDQSGRVWLIGRPTSAAANVVTVAVWNGNSWSEPRDVTFSFFDDRTQLSTNLNCVNLSIAGGTAGVIGCDARSDVWATQNAIGLDQWLPSLESAWSQPQDLTSQSGTVPPEALPDVAADSTGQVYAVWNQLPSDGSSSELFVAVWRDGRWSGATRIVTGETAQTEATIAATRQARQPAIVADNRDRVHLVWSGGAAGEIFYSWAYARDLGSGQRWNEATRVSPSSALGHWPDIVADPQGTNLYVIYALPFNEQRGVYLVVSADNGQSWQTPIKVFDAAAAGWASVDRARLAFDSENQILHAVWQRRTLPGQNQPEEIYYASSRDAGQTWSAPLKVADGVVAWPQVIVPSAGQVYLAWCQTDANQSNVRGQFSPDGGQRWSAPALINRFDEVSCPVSLATDGLGQMHLASTAANAGGESILLTALWNGQTWNQP
ncbi:MAG: exo-alpha-sialidase, partial [Chloroflexi bacterium]|nr:exo-alpha-sialidase [Chloroflexota bacterium]